MEQDHIILEARKNRETLSARFDHDLEKLFVFFKEQEQKRDVKDVSSKENTSRRDKKRD